MSKSWTTERPSNTRSKGANGNCHLCAGFDLVLEFGSSMFPQSPCVKCLVPDTLGRMWSLTRSDLVLDLLSLWGCVLKGECGILDTPSLSFAPWPWWGKGLVLPCVPAISYPSAIGRRQQLTQRNLFPLEVDFLRHLWLQWKADCILWGRRMHHVLVESKFSPLLLLISRILSCLPYSDANFSSEDLTKAA